MILNHLTSLILMTLGAAEPNTGRAVIAGPNDTLIPLVDCGAKGVRTVIRVTNTEDRPVEIKVIFSDPAGKELKLALAAPVAETNHEAKQTVPAFGTLQVVTGGEEELPVGFAIIQAPGARVLAQASIEVRLQNGNWFPYSFSSANPRARRSIVRFDNTAGFATTVWLVNTDPQRTDFTVTIRNDAGEKLFSGGYYMNATSNAFLVPADVTADAANKSGTFEIVAQEGKGLAMVAVRSNRTGGYTIIDSQSLSDWQ